jgi:hypothetical protein
MISTSLPSARCQWVKSDCQTSLGAAASNRISGAARALARLGHDEAGCVEDAPDRRGRRDGHTLALKVPGDGGRARVQASGDKVRSEFDDPVSHGARGPVRAYMRPPGPGLDGFEAAIPVSLQEPVQMPATDAALGRSGRDGELR